MTKSIVRWFVVRYTVEWLIDSADKLKRTRVYVHVTIWLLRSPPFRHVTSCMYMYVLWCVCTWTMPGWRAGSISFHPIIWASGSDYVDTLVCCNCKGQRDRGACCLLCQGLWTLLGAAAAKYQFRQTTQCGGSQAMWNRRCRRRLH
jgi:hypothetical protein